MPCTTILVGKKATNDGSTLIARTDDGFFDVKKLVVVNPKQQPKHYKSKIAHLSIDLPENPMRYTACPGVDQNESGIWAAAGINEANVGMTATETITTNSRVLGADPLVRYQKAKSRREKDIPGGIGEEDFVTIVLPYIHTAREGVLRLGSLLEQYGTYESNGIAFNDEHEIWWLETIGGHHWIAQKVRDEECVIMPNQFGLDRFDFDDAFGDQNANLCSADLIDFIKENHLDLNNGTFDPRSCFGSRSDMDHIYNTPRAWFLGRFLCPTKYKWEGEDADFTPESDNIPWSFVPEKKVSVEDVKYLLSSHYQGTPYDPYIRADNPKKGRYRTIGINRTGDMEICQIRPDMPEKLKGLEWICFGSTTFDTVLPVYPHVEKLPKYLTDVSMDASTENFYWASRLIGALADPHFASSIVHVERYQLKTMSEARRIVGEYDKKMAESGDFSLMDEANRKLCEMMKKETVDTLNKVLLDASQHMKNGYNRADN